MLFSDLPIGAIFMCDKGKFIKTKNVYDKYNGNAISYTFHTIANIQAATKVKWKKER